MVRYLFTALVCGLVLLSDAHANEGGASDYSYSKNQLSQLLRQAADLQRTLEQIDHRLDYPKGPRVVVFISNDDLSLRFQPTHLILQFSSGTQLQQYISPEQFERFATGNPLRVLSFPLPDEAEQLEVTIGGHDQQGRWVVETLRQALGGEPQSVYLEYRLASSSVGDALWEARVW